MLIYSYYNIHSCTPRAFTLMMQAHGGGIQGVGEKTNFSDQIDLNRLKTDERFVDKPRNFTEVADNKIFPWVGVGGVVPLSPLVLPVCHWLVTMSTIEKPYS